MSRLLIALNAPGVSSTEWAYAVQAENGRLTHHASGAPANLPKLGHVTVVVPALALSWHRIALPKAQSARVRAALEGMLEDKLLDEPANLHFALQTGAKPGDSGVWVAVCDKAWLRAQLMRLVEVGLPITRVVPEAAPVPVGAGAQVHVGGSEHQPVMAWADEQGVQHWPLAALAGSGLDLDRAQISAEPAVAQRAEAALQRPVNLLANHERWVQAASGDWNLAQFDLRNLGQSGAGPRLLAGLRDLGFAPKWRPLRWALGFGLVVNLLGLNLYAWSQSRALDAKRGLLNSTLTQTFPQVKVVIDAKRQMQREVAALRQATGGASERDVDVMLTALATAAPDIKAPSGLDYANGELTLKGVGLGPEQLEPTNQRLSASGLVARLEGQNLLLRAQAAK